MNGVICGPKYLSGDYAGFIPYIFCLEYEILEIIDSFQSFEEQACWNHDLFTKVVMMPFTYFLSGWHETCSRFLYNFSESVVSYSQPSWFR